jgi:quinoprotein dehydrogenase-associated probable ABC transporter substrate-binding protein
MKIIRRYSRANQFGMWSRACVATVALAAAAVPAAAQRAELITQTELRVCADPSNLPFSNQAGEGFENRIAGLIGADLELPVSFVWFPQTVGFVRNTLRARACDLVMGTVAGDGVMDTTNSYYHTGYMIVTRTADHIGATSLGDPALADKRIGLIAATPPTDLALKHGLMPHVRAYSLAVDTRSNNPAREMLKDVADGAIDVALVWGPVAGYAIRHDQLPLTASFLASEPDAPRLDYRIAMGVRANEPEWRRRINQAIRKQAPAIAKVLADYGVPMLDEQNRPVASAPP